MPRVDAHLHVWRAAEGETPGVNTLVPPQTDVPLKLADRTMRANGIDRAVLVQPVFRREDNSYVADCARAEPDRFAAVCVVDPRTPGADQRLERWVQRGCRGVRLRPRLRGEEASFGHSSSFPWWQAAARLRVVVSILCDTGHPAMIASLAERFPQVPIVIDHMAHPNPAFGIAEPGFQRLLGLSRYSRVMVKLSGYYHFSAQSFPFADCWDLIRAVYDAFGPRRLIWGSDFPHVTLRCGYEQSLQLPARALNAWPSEDRDRVMGENTLELYWPATRPA